MTKPNVAELIFFWILFAIIGLLAFVIMSPYFTPLFLAMVLAIAFSSVHKHLLKIFRNKETLAALITVLLVLCLILLPLVFLGVLMFQEALSVYEVVAKDGNMFGVTHNLVNSTESYVRQFIPSFEVQAALSSYVESVLQWAVSNLQLFFSSIFSFLFDIIIILIAMFFFCRDGKKLRDFAVKWSPLSDTYDESIIAKLELAVVSVVKGALLTAVIQGALVGIGFALFGIPNPVLWGVVATVAALIPVVGTGVITIPVALFLIIDQQFFAGVGLLIWALCVGVSDNISRPFLIRRGIDIHPFLILLSVIGGLTYFGPIGFLFGPIVLAFFFALLDVYTAMAKGRAVNGVL